MLSEIDEMSSSFELFEFSFVGRNANKVAHECARYACTHVESRSWDDLPDFLENSLRTDCNPDQ
jgi:hypothetical protein